MNCENGGNFFLLQTENFQPLLNYIDELSFKLEENQQKIEDLSTRFDNDFEFPTYVDSGNVGNNSMENTSRDQNDILHMFLNRKYNLEDIKTEEIDHEDPEIKRLMTDIQKLRVLRSKNSQKNLELYQTIQNFELFVAKEILPNFRKEITIYWTKCLQDIKNKQLSEKLECEKELWEIYNRYLVYLNKLVAISEILIKASTEINSDELVKVEQKLEIINRIKEYVENGSTLSI